MSVQIDGDRDSWPGPYVQHVTLQQTIETVFRSYMGWRDPPPIRPTYSNQFPAAPPTIPPTAVDDSTRAMMSRHICQRRPRHIDQADRIEPRDHLTPSQP